MGGSIAILLTYRSGLATPRAFHVLSAVLGVLSLLGIALLRIFSFSELNTTAIGGGGVERLIVYPIVVWELLLGVLLVWS